MTVLVGAALGACVALLLAVLWYGRRLGPASPHPLVFFLLAFALAWVLSHLVRWTFASRPVDGAVLGASLWLAGAVWEGSGALFRRGSARIEAGAALYWALTLPAVGAFLAYYQGRATDLSAGWSLFP